MPSAARLIEDPIPVIERRVADAGSQAAVADALEIPRQYLNDIIHRRKPASDDVLRKFGLERVVRFRKIVDGAAA